MYVYMNLSGNAVYVILFVSKVITCIVQIDSTLDYLVAYIENAVVCQHSIVYIFSQPLLMI